MSNLTFTNYEGWGQFAHDNYGYSQAVRVGDRIEISGQGTSHGAHCIHSQLLTVSQVGGIPR